MKNATTSRFALTLNTMFTVAFIATCALLANAAFAQGEKILPLNDTTGIKSTFDQSPTRTLKVIPGKDGQSALEMQGVTVPGDKNHYFGIMIPLGHTWDFTKSRLEVDARTTQGANAGAFYVRAYNKGEKEPCWSFFSWSSLVTEQWKTFGLQGDGYASSLQFESKVVEDRKPTNVDRLEFIVGSTKSGVSIDLQISNLRTAPLAIGLDDLAAPKKLMRIIPVVTNGAADATLLYPDSAAGKAAAMEVAQAVQQKTGVLLEMRPGTEADREFDENVILVGNVFNNPAMLLLYAREFIPVDNICPGPGGYLVQTVHDPFGNEHGTIVVGASDDADLKSAEDAFATKVSKSTYDTKSLTFPKFFEAKYNPGFYNNKGNSGMVHFFSGLSQKAPADTVQAGLKEGQDILNRGQHTSIAGLLSKTAVKYQLTGDSAYAQRFVALWDLYAKSALGGYFETGAL